jgi:ribosomal protein L29
VTSKELRAKKDQEIGAFIQKWAAELAVLKIQASVGQCQKTAQLQDLKKGIARAKTILRERMKPNV